MLETAALLLFVAMLVAGIVLQLPLVALLIVGWFIFFDYGLVRGFGMGELARMSLAGLRSVGSVLLLFALIGSLTAAWRASGTIPAITCWSAQLVGPRSVVPAAFVLTAAMSMLVGSSFAASATVGVICMVIGNALGANPALLGGAIISGAFFGDRCSPMSSSAALVAEITHTNVFHNVGRMLRSAAVPTLLALGLYLLFGAVSGPQGHVPDFARDFAKSFVLAPYVALPTLVILVLSVAKVDVRVTMLVSLLSALALCVGVQGVKLAELPQILVWGFHTSNEHIAHMVDGGGIMSMAEVALIVAVASTYSGIFEGTSLLMGLRGQVLELSRRTTPFVGVLLTSLATTFVACDQVVAIMLTHQLCDGVEHGGEGLALDLENSAVVVPALVPWSTSCVGIVAFVGMPTPSIACAFLPLFIPAWTLATSLWMQRHAEFVDTPAARLQGYTAEDDARRWVAAA